MDEMEDAAELLEEEEGPKLEGFTRFLEIGGRAIVIAYGVGFFIDSYFDAKYGVTYLNPFRSRVAFTGIALLVQIAIIVLVFTGESLWRLSSTFWQFCASVAPERTRHLYEASFVICWLIDTVIVGLLFRFSLTLNPSYLRGLFTHPFWKDLGEQSRSVDAGAASHLPQNAASMPIWHWLLVGVSLFVVLTIPNLLKLRGRASRRILDSSASMTIALGALFLWAEMQGQDALGYSFVAYVALVRLAVIARMSDPKFKRPEPRLAIAALVIMIPVLYAETIYTNVLPQWGGAPKIKLLIRFEHQIVPFGCSAPAYLLEETEEGYYLLRPNSDKDANTQDAKASLDLEAVPCPTRPAQSGQAEDGSTATTTHLFDPRAYSAVYVPRREVFQVLYERSSVDSH